VQAADHGNDVELPGGGQRHSHGDFVGLRAGDGEVDDLQVAGCVEAQELGKLHRPRVGVPGRLMQESTGHFANGFDELGVRMAQNHAHHAGSEVVIFLAIHIDEFGALAGLEDNARRVAPAEHGFGIASLEIRMHVREAKALLH
jgi:hypothetical protein